MRLKSTLSIKQLGVSPRLTFCSPLASDAIVVGFNVHPTTEAVQAKETEGIDVRTYNVIYELVSYIRSAMEGLLDPEVREVVIGRAEVRELFKVPRLGLVAGSYVNWGRITYNRAASHFARQSINSRRESQLPASI